MNYRNTAVGKDTEEVGALPRYRQPRMFWRMCMFTCIGEALEGQVSRRSGSSKAKIERQPRSLEHRSHTKTRTRTRASYRFREIFKIR